MRSDEELIDGLRSGLATLQPRSDLIDCLRERAAADQPRDLPFRPPRFDKRLQQMRQTSRTDAARGTAEVSKQKPGQAQRESKPYPAKDKQAAET